MLDRNDLILLGSIFVFFTLIIISCVISDYMNASSKERVQAMANECKIAGMKAGKSLDEIMKVCKP